jgi:hypothetical protein
MLSESEKRHFYKCEQCGEMKHPLRRIAESGSRAVNRQASHGIGFALNGLDLQVAKVKQRFRADANYRRAQRVYARQIEYSSGNSSMLWDDLKRKLKNRLAQLNAILTKRTCERERASLYSEFEELLATCSAKLTHRYTTFCWMLTRRFRPPSRITPKPRDVTAFIERLPQLYELYGAHSVLLMRATAKLGKCPKSKRR